MYKTSSKKLIPIFNFSSSTFFYNLKRFFFYFLHPWCKCLQSVFSLRYWRSILSDTENGSWPHWVTDYTKTPRTNLHAPSRWGWADQNWSGLNPSDSWIALCFLLWSCSLSIVMTEVFQKFLQDEPISSEMMCTLSDINMFKSQKI